MFISLSLSLFYLSVVWLCIKFSTIHAVLSFRFKPGPNGYRMTLFYSGVKTFVSFVCVWRGLISKHFCMFYDINIFET